MAGSFEILLECDFDTASNSDPTYEKAFTYSLDWLVLENADEIRDVKSVTDVDSLNGDLTFIIYQESFPCDEVIRGENHFLCQGASESKSESPSMTSEKGPRSLNKSSVSSLSGSLLSGVSFVERR